MGRCATLQWLAPPVSAMAARRDSPARVITAPSSKRRTSARSRCRLCATDVRRPGSNEGLSTENCAESGLSIGTIVRLAGKMRRQSRIDERKCQRLGQPAAEQHSPHEPISLDSRVGWRWWRKQRREGRRQTVVSVVPRDLFDQIDFALRVDAECRRGNLPPALFLRI